MANAKNWLVSTPSKMPGYSFSLPAGPSCPASKITIKKYGANSTCSMCYAKSGNYRFPNVKDAQQKRFDFVRDSLKHDNGDRFVAAMIEVITRTTKNKEKVFRIHDSGDFFSPQYADAWYRICAALPEVKFWAPTREYLRDTMLPSLRRLASLPNVAIRPSAAENNAPAPVIAGLHAGSAVFGETAHIPKGHNVCPATSTDLHACDDHKCRKCWDAKDKAVIYKAHGQLARRQLKVLDAA